MKNYNFKFCNVELTVLTPVHIGDGVIINRKEFYTDGKTVFINDQEKLYEFFASQGKEVEQKFVQYLLKSSKEKDIKECFNVKSSLYKERKLAKYILAYDNDTNNINEIHTFIKDAYGDPYIPGSSLKGMIKSAILLYKLSQNSYLQDTIKDEILKESKKDKMDFSDINAKISSILDKNCGLKAFSGLVVSDSASLKKDQLQLVGKIDYKLPISKYPGYMKNNYRSGINKLPTYREALKKFSKTEFSIKIDKDKLNIDLNYIKEALNYNEELVHKYFYKEFEVKEFEKGIAHLGGGVGFTSKTILYQLFGDDAKDLVYKIIMSQIDNRASHKPFKDILTPHVLKGYTKNLKEEMGRVKLIFKD